MVTSIGIAYSELTGVNVQNNHREKQLRYNSATAG